jgi:intein/homing endonuclease
MSKCKINEKFFNKWGSKMVYVLGYLYADGSLSDCGYIRAKYISVTSIDRDRIELFKRLLKSAHNIKVEPPPTKNSHARYTLRIGSHKLYKKLGELGLYPNKSLNVKFPQIPKPLLNHFIRGYFDGDGCVFLEKSIGINGQPILKRLLVALTSGSSDFLRDLGQIIGKIIHKNETKIYNSHRSYQLRYNTSDTIKLFEFMYNSVHGDLFMRRKYNKFKEYLYLRPERITSKIKVILKKHK